MNKQVFGGKGIIESGLTASIAALFAVGLVYFPPLFLLVFLLPVPFVVLITRHGLRYGILALLTASLLIGFLTGILSTIIILTLFAPIALVMGALVKRNHSDFAVIAAGAAVSIFTIFSSIQLIGAGGYDLLGEIAMTLREALQAQGETLSSMNLTVKNVEDLVHSVMVIFPGMIIVQSLLGSFINYYISLSILNRAGGADRPLSELSYFRLPASIGLGCLLIVGLTYLAGALGLVNTNGLMSNVILIFTFVFFAQGLAYISFLMKRLGIKPPLRVGLLALSFVITPFLTLISLLGFVDALFDLRKLRPKE